MILVRYLIYLLLFFLPFQTRLILRPGDGWEYKIIGLFATELLLWLIVFLYIFKKKSKEQEPALSLSKGTKNKTVLLFALCSLLFFLVNILIVSVDRLVASQQIIHILEVGILFWILVSGQINRLNAIYAFLGGLSLQAALAIYQFLNQSSFASRFLGLTLHDSAMAGASVIENLDGRWLRAYGGLPHPNILAGYLALGLLLIAFVFQCSSVSRRGRLLLLADTVLLATALFFTFSRAAWLALLAALIIFLISEKRRLGKISNDVQVFVSSIPLVFIILSLIFAPLLITRVTAQGRLETVSTSERIAGYSEAWQLLKKHPFLGVGAGNYTAAVYKELDSSRPSWTYQPLHNGFLLVLTEIGIVGIILLIILLLLYKRARNKEQGTKLSCSLFPSTGSGQAFVLCSLFLVLGSFDHYLWSLYSGLMLLAVGAGLTSLRIYDKKD